MGSGEKITKAARGKASTMPRLHTQRGAEGVRQCRREPNSPPARVPREPARAMEPKRR